MARPVSAAGRLARFGFADLLGAARLLGSGTGLGLWREDEQRPVDPAAAAVLARLSAAADPDLALRQVHRLREAAIRRPDGADPLAALLADAELAQALIAVLGASIALGDGLVAAPDQWPQLVAAGRWPHSAEPGAGEPAAGEGEPLAGADLANPAGLRAGYRSALVRIAAADLTGRADLEITMARLSRLADATLVAALRLAEAQVGRAPRLSVIAMGKCGGGELNYVSDVDVIFVAADDDDLAAGQAVAARLIEICGGVAWQVDASLRPEGSQGPLVRTLRAHLAYYRRWARTWEFQALLKARPVAGDVDLARHWLHELEPLVWQAAERPEAVQDVRAMRQRIIDSLPPRQRDREIKRGPGGLRDIEFAVQLLQLVHGRGDESLRSPSTLDALRALTGRGYVGRSDGEALIEAYRFLRTVEHRLQLQRLRRTHTVPADPAAVRWLAQALGFRADPRADAAGQFRAAWARHAQEVRRLHAKLVYRPLVQAVARVPGEALRLTPAAAGARLEILGFRDPPAALRHLQALTGGVSRYAAIQHTLLPVLLDELANAPEPDRGLLAYRQVSDALRGTPWFLRLLRDSGPVAQRLARLLGLSRYAADLLSRDPEALRVLADDTELAPRPLQSLVDGFVAAADRHAGVSSAIAAVRASRRRELFRIACGDLLSTSGADLMPAGGPLEVTAIGQALSHVTDATLHAALRVARAATGAGGLAFSIIGMGRLGGSELSYGSDADLLFVYRPAPGLAEDLASAAAHQIAEGLRRLLSSPAAEPPLGIDVDLRPEGRQGPLVRSLAAYRRYYDQRARIWEAQALLRARFVAGDPELGAEFTALADRVRYPEGGPGPEQIVEIRRIKARVDAERLPRGADPTTHAKLGRGGLADVEWAVQLLQLRHGYRLAALRTPRTLAALAAAGDAGLVDKADATALEAGWLMATRVRNALMLVRGRPSDQLPRKGSELAGVARVLGRPAAADPGAFLDDYLRTARRASAAAGRVFLDR
jgi:[glutamine synthetase] adenylyltransferase / [glutamine synthetase]-adenylyl-L-tyrosine phosphorylase